MSEIPLFLLNYPVSF